MSELSWPGAVAATIAVLMGGVLLAILASEGDSSIFGAIVIAAAAATATAGTVVHRPVWRLGLLWVAAGILGGLGALGIFSIGLPLLVAAGFAVAGTAEPARHLGHRWLTGVVALSVPASAVAAVAVYVAIT